MKVLFPRTLDELQAMMLENPQGQVMGGGTDLLVQFRHAGQKPPVVFCIERLEQLQQLEWVDNEFHIGAGVTQQRLLASEVIRTEFGALFHALTELASPPIRHVATLVGNVCTASPAADTLPALYVLGAEVEILSPTGRKRIPINAFITGPGINRLQTGEVVSGVILPRQPRGTAFAYHKVGKRKAMAIAVASLAAVWQTTEEGRIQRIKLAWGSVGPTVVVAPDVESFLNGKTLSEESLSAAGRLAMSAVSPIDDIRASADYRRRLAGNLLLKLLERQPD